jgi:hypothetical protein
MGRLSSVARYDLANVTSDMMCLENLAYNVSVGGSFVVSVGIKVLFWSVSVLLRDRSLCFWK